jgi:hypothetical protein
MPIREPLPTAPAGGGRVERDGQERMRLRFKPDAEVESVLFVTPGATLESYDPATDEVTWTMPARGERAWDVTDIARKRGFTFADDVAVPTPVPQQAAAAPVAAPPDLEGAEPEPAPAKAPPQVNGPQPLAVTTRARPGAERAATRLERAASAAAASARARTDRLQPAVARSAQGRQVVVKLPTGTPAVIGQLRERLDELSSRMNGSARTAAMLIGVAMITALLSIWAESVRLRLLSELERVGEISAAAYQQTEARQFILALALLILYVLSAVAFLVWIQRSYARLAARGIIGLRYTPITAVIWFLVPVAFLFVPRRVVTELWHANPLPAGARLERRRRVPMLVAVWWTAFVAFAISAVLTGATTPSPNIADLFRQTWTNVASDLLALVAGGLAIAVISAIELRQPPA